MDVSVPSKRRKISVPSKRRKISVPSKRRKISVSFASIGWGKSVLILVRIMCWVLFFGKMGYNYVYYVPESSDDKEYEET